MDLATELRIDGRADSSSYTVQEGPGNTLKLPTTSNAVQIERLLLLEMINIVPDYLVVKDRDSRFVLSNRVVAADLGLEIDDLLGKSDLELHPKELAPKYFADEQRIMSTGEPEIDIEEFILTAKGKV